MNFNMIPVADFCSSFLNESSIRKPKSEVTAGLIMVYIKLGNYDYGANKN